MQKLIAHPRVTMYHYSQYLCAASLGNLYASKVLEINSLKHLLSVVVDNNDVLLDGGSLRKEKQNIKQKESVSYISLHSLLTSFSP